jgi:micrococcal nuclease
MLRYFHKEKSDHTIITYANTIRFVPPITEGIVVKVYDGDTITVASKLPYKESPLYRFSVRLSEIDAPELNSECMEERNLALHSRQMLSDKILYRNVYLKNTNTEKYGRLLADVYLDDVHINPWMISNGYAVHYIDKKKRKY